MKTSTLVLLFTVGMLMACGDEEDPENNGTNIPGSPSWIAGYPHVAYGAVSADLNLETDKNAKVYWVITQTPIQLNAEQLVTEAIDSKLDEISIQGIADTKANEKTRKIIGGLRQNTQYFLYMVAQSVSDTLLQQKVEVVEFKTHSRQDTLEYFSNAENRKVKYLLYRPEEVLKYPDKQYPICFFLGGNGEVATNEKPVNMIRNGSLPEYIHKDHDVPMMVMSIQHTKKDWNTQLIDEGVEHAFSTYPINKKKVYMTGISGGGYGCWNYAVSYGDKLTAIIPISGGGNKSKACNLKNVAIWAFHNQTDNTVSATNSQTMIDAVETCPPNKDVKLLFFPDTGHDCWRRVFDETHPNWNKSPGVEKFNVYDWLLTQSK
jgi:predicted peptidase